MGRNSMNAPLFASGGLLVKPDLLRGIKAVAFNGHRWCSPSNLS